MSSVSGRNNVDIGVVTVGVAWGTLKFNERRGTLQGYMTLLFESSRITWLGRDSGTHCKTPMDIDSGTICRELDGLQASYTGVGGDQGTALGKIPPNLVSTSTKVL